MPLPSHGLRTWLNRAVALVALLTISITASAEEWTQYLGPNRDSTTSERVVAWPPTSLWTASIGGGYSSVVTSNGKMFAIGHAEDGGGGTTGTDTVTCLDADTGAVLWTYSYAVTSKRGNFGGGGTTLPGDIVEFGPRATPVADANSVWTISLYGDLFCFDAETGRVKWYRNATQHLGGGSLGYGNSSSPMLYNNLLLVDVGGALVALNKDTGDEVWRANGGAGWWNCPSPILATDGGTTMVLFGSREIVAADVTDGSLLWQYNMNREEVATPIVSGDKLFFSTYPDNGASGLLQFTAAGRSVAWTGTVETYHTSNTISGGYLYVMQNEGTEWLGNDPALSSFMCIELATGTEQWTEPAMGWANPVVVDDELLILKEDGTLIHAAANPSAYAEFGNIATVSPPGLCWTAPAISDGRVYVRNYHGDLETFSIANAVSVTASDPTALETSDTATFMITRVGDTTGPLNVAFTTSGNSFTLSTTSPATIPAGLSFVDVLVTPLADGDTNDETIVLTITPDTTNYSVTTNDSATVHIVDVPAAPTVTIAATDAWTLENGPDTAAFTVTSSAAANVPVVLDFAISGDAVPADYMMLGNNGLTVTIPAGATTAQITVLAKDDADLTNDTLTLTLQPGGPYYTVGAPASASVMFADDDNAFVDTDLDTMDDDWEMAFWGDLSHTGGADSDADGLSDADEYANGTDPTDADTDKDNADDNVEIVNSTDPLDPLSFFISTGGGGGGGGGGCGVAPTRFGSAGGSAWFAFMLLLAGLALRLIWKLAVPSNPHE